MPLCECFKKYKLVLFDMDGVITSEDSYFTAAVLSAYELMHPERNETACEIQEKKDTIRNLLLQGEKINARLKELAVNTNWDLSYLVYMMAQSYRSEFNDEKDLFAFVYQKFCAIQDEAPQLYDTCAKIFSERTGYPYEDAKRLQKLWKILQNLFQEWYLGEADYISYYGKKPVGLPDKPGLIAYEKPIVPMDKLLRVLDAFDLERKRLGVGTGRPTLEIVKTLQIFGILERFDPDAFITFTDITKAEEELKKHGIKEDLSKPHPYIFLKGALGKNFDNLDLYKGNYDKTLLKNVLVVGDAGSDIISAKRAGLDFAAVLTGVSGKKAADYFKKMGADYILDSFCNFINDDGENVQILC